jgi:alkylation response protein AidB-like acyl-CoA dehydrogenase
MRLRVFPHDVHREKEEPGMTASPITASPDELVTRVGPTVRRYAARAEAERRLAPEVVEALHEAGVFRIWVPRAHGGLELEPRLGLWLVEELSRIDGSVGWIAGNHAALAVLLQNLPAGFSAELFTDPRALMAGAAGPPGIARPDPGGYRLTGRWPFVSGCHYASWLHGTTLIMDGEAPRMSPDGNPLLLLCFYKPAEAEILDTWHTLGMRGTGSHDVRVEDVFVPEAHTVLMGPLDAPGPAYAGPLYRLGGWVSPVTVAAVALGIARAALDDLIALAAGKTPSYTQTGLADKPTAQDRVARARALIDAARSYVYTAVEDAWAFVQSGRRITVVQGVPLGLAGTFGVDAALRAVQIVHEVAGTTAFRDEHRFQQYFRDVHTISQHAFAAAGRYESLGKLLLGRPSDWPFHYV